ncbi:MAG TPA: Tat pathway signal sequence domain protein, partial [Opitutus sp.]|nr:Tat pathway signal sequence domain protein [Opitutus sp.]
RLRKTGDVIIEHLTRDGREIARDGRLVLLRQESPEGLEQPELFTGGIERVTLEQQGPVRAVVKMEGRHARVDGGRSWLPLVVRLYFYAGSEAVRVMHTIVYDGDEQKDFVRGLGVRFDVPLRGELYDRHVRFSGEGDGLFGEAVRGLTGLRRDPGAAVRAAQIAGEATPPRETWAPQASNRLHYIAAFGDWSLFQSTADGFEIRKRTKPGYTWISSARGRRAGGLGYVGTPQGGVAFGLRNFWQSHPSELEILNATTDRAQVTAWVWSPQAGAMDLRGYHDSTADTYAKQLEAMEINYEDYEPGFDKPEGVARTSELWLWAAAATPSRETLAHMAEVVRTPPVLMAAPAYLHACEVFGRLWAPVDRSTPAKRAIEDMLDWNFRFYEGQREQRRWYGFWNYGDVMHSYDADRHEWKYDVGGFAWDNSELSTDIWLWLYFLRTGRADVFRFAEAMTRHTGEVDVHHLGRFAPLGSRHNVLHWGCSAKQLRISTATNRRYYYFLTGDERVGDLMREQIEAVRALAVIQANRKVAPDRVTKADPNATEVYAGFGTDWGSAAGAWLTEWERTGDAKMRDRLLASMRSIAAQPRGFFTGGSRMNLNTGEFAISDSQRASVSHLSAVFGLVEVCAELVQLLDEPSFTQAWLDYCELYNAPAEEQTKRFGQPLRGVNLQQGHSRLTAFAARTKGNADLAKRAWDEFYRAEGSEGRGRRARAEAQRLSGPAVLQPVDEAAWVSTNGTAQWGLAAIHCLALAGEALPPESTA